MIFWRAFPTRPASWIACAVCLSLFLPLSSARSETLRALASGQFVANVPFDVQLAAAKDIGLRRARIGIRIYEVEKPGGFYDWSAVDKRIRTLMGAGITPIITLFGRSRLVERAAASPDGKVALSDAEIRAFATFATQVVQRYGASHDGRKIIYEIWNEPNTKTFWGSPPDPEAYAQLAESACRSIRGQNPSAVVVGLAMEGSPLNKPYYVRSYGIDIYREWAARAATPQLMKCVDGISLHPYRREPETYLSENQALVQFVAEHGRAGGGTMIVNSEWGYSVGAKGASNLEEQASLDLRLLLIGAGYGRVTNLYQLVNGGSDLSDTRQTYGLFDLSGASKPAGAAIKHLLSTIGDYEVDGVEPVADIPGAFRFKAHTNDKTRREAQVLWRAAGESTVSLQRLKSGSPSVVRDLIDNRDLQLVGSELKITPKPVLLIFEEGRR